MVQITSIPLIRITVLRSNCTLITTWPTVQGKLD